MVRPMDQEAVFPIKVMAWIALGGSLALGGYMLKHDQRLFGFHPDVPSDNSSARGYGKAQIWLLWLLMVKVFAFLAFAL